jgi:DNA repair exonuclease SbcCD ATPase subunit
MWIKGISVNGFGKLKINQLNFSKRINILYGTNESGKTSLTYFLLNSLSEPGPELTRFTPWEHAEFSGKIELGDGQSYSTDFISRDYLPPFKRSTLEAIGFHLEDELFDISEGVDGSVVATLKRKMEETDMGRKLSLAAEKIDSFIAEVPETIASVKKELEATEKEIEEIHIKIDTYNSLLRKKRTFTTQIPEKKEDIKNKKEIFKEKCAQYIEELKKEIHSLEKERSEISAKMIDYEWVKNKDPETVSRALRLSRNNTDLRENINRSKKAVSDLREQISGIRKQVEQKFHILNIENPDELEKISLKIKNLRLLTKISTDRSVKAERSVKAKPVQPVQPVQPVKNNRADRSISTQSTAVKKNPIWDFFELNENILDQVKAAEKNKPEHLEIYNQQIEFLQRLQVNKDSRYYLFKFLSISSIIVSIVLLALHIILPSFQAWLTIAFVISALINAITIAFWYKTKEDRKILSQNRDDLEKQRVSSWSRKTKIWEKLNSLGISDMQQLQNIYADFLENKEREKAASTEIQPIKIQEEVEEEIQEEVQDTVQDEYQKEINTTLAEFNLNELPQAEGNPIDFIENVHNQSQVIVAKIRNLEEKVRSHELNRIDMENEVISMAEDLNKLLGDLDLNAEKLNIFEDARFTYRELQLKETETISTIDRLKNRMDLQSMPEHLTKLSVPISQDENSLETMSSELETINNTIGNVSINATLVFEKLAHKDALNRRLATLQAMPKKLSVIRSKITDTLNTYIDEYGKTFQATFTGILTKIIDRNIPIAVQDNLTLKLPLGGVMQDISNYMSRATYGQMLFAYKLALYKVLSSETLPLIIDNAFINYDDERLEKALQVLHEETENRQVLILTSDKRLFGKRVINKESINKIKLDDFISK